MPTPREMLLTQLINQGIPPSTIAALTAGAPLPAAARTPIPGFGGPSSGTPGATVAGSPQAQIMDRIQAFMTPRPLSNVPGLPPLGLTMPYSTMAAAPFGGLSAPSAITAAPGTMTGSALGGLYPTQYGINAGAGKGAGGGWTGPPVKLPWWGAPAASALSASKLV
jgi:hypothetical protein